MTIAVDFRVSNGILLYKGYKIFETGQRFKTANHNTDYDRAMKVAGNGCKLDASVYAFEYQLKKCGNIRVA